MADAQDSSRARLLVESVLHPGQVDQFTAGAIATAPEDFPGLRLRVVAHLAHIEKASVGHAAVDVDAARAVAHVLGSLLDEPDQYDARERELIRGAVEYFVLDRDERRDLTDAIGFDDDARVLNAVLDSLHRADLRIDL